MLDSKNELGFEVNTHEYSEHQAIAESTRCLMCDEAPCMSGCPAHVNVTDFLRRIRYGDFIGAAKLIRENNIFGATCASICPSEKLCQQSCSNTELDAPVDIPGLQKFVCDYQSKIGMNNISKPAPLKEKVAIIGAGPGGLAAGFELRRKGYNVSIFESNSFSGGMLRAGIPTYRLDRNVLDAEIDLILGYGVEIKYNHKISDLKKLKQQYDAIFISIGLQSETEMKIPGCELTGVYYALDFLKKQYIDNNVSLGKRVAVIGGGDVAMDCARTALRIDNVEDVYIVYRRSAKEMPAIQSEIDDAQTEGVIFQNLLAPAAIEGDGKVERLVCQQVKLGTPDDSGRRKPVIQENTSVVFDVDNVIFAIGQSAEKAFIEANPDLKVNNKGLIEVNKETFETSIPGVFAGGDIVGGTTAVESIGNAKKAAEAIHKILSKGNN